MSLYYEVEYVEYTVLATSLRIFGKQAVGGWPPTPLLPVGAEAPCTTEQTST